jgi:protein-L-isoaspartate(D-aspartate) O-methyltransferase
MAMNFDQAREDMVAQQLRARGIEDRRVLDAMKRVPRHRFVDSSLEMRAYDDCALPTGAGQTISQPYIVALMSELLQVGAGDRVLEIGTGSGYQAAVLVELGAEVYTVERIAALADAARARLDDLGYARHVHLRTGDGSEGWNEAAPFAAILITAAVREVPRPLVAQLAAHGRMVLPLGDAELQGLACIRRADEGLQVNYCGECRFVKMIGEYGWEEQGRDSDGEA